MLPVVALVGRPNVGKSTLFNRLVGRHAALTHDAPGVTRDRHYAEVEWGGRRFLAVDTGGFVVGEGDPLSREVRAQAERAMAQATLIVLVVDGRDGPLAPDLELAGLARRSGKRTFVALNKLDQQKAEDAAPRADFYRLGLQELYAVSAEHGRGIGPLLDDLVKLLPEAVEPAPPEEGDDRPRVAILGRPNVGKSTFANALLGESRFATSPVAGTTRDALDAEVAAKGRRYVLTDTAGIRRKGSAASELELAGIARALEALGRSDVAVLLLDAIEPAVEQDARLAGLCAERSKPLVLAVNKSDLLTGAAGRKGVKEAIAEHLPFLPQETPLLFVSALRGSGLAAVLPLCGRLHDQSAARLPTPELNRFLRDAEDAHPAPRAGGGPVRLYYMAQVSARPPTFLVHVNRPEGINEAYRRFLAGRLRDRFDLRVPVRFVFRKRTRRPSRGS
ncbi:MAG: ribosome biogenesis GTPase Der [Myxococcales bacterium]